MSVEIEDVVTHNTRRGNSVVLGVGTDNKLYVNGKPVVTELKLASFTTWAVVLGGFSTAGMFFLELYKLACK